jgi:hypothetical protein
MNGVLPQWAQRGGAPHPELIAVMVNSHHQTAAEAHEGDRRLEGFAVGPEVHDANLCLGEAVRSLDDGFEGDPLL